MTLEAFRTSLGAATAPPSLCPELLALWLDGHGDWAAAHAHVDDLETPDAMAVHAYLHRKEGDAANAAHWYRRAGERFRRATLEEEWDALVTHFLTAN